LIPLFLVRSNHVLVRLGAAPVCRQAGSFGDGLNLIQAILLARGNHGTFVTAVLFGGVCGLHLFYRGFRMLQRKRLIENTPTSTIRAAAMGLIEVNGLATGPYTLTAPVTGFPCYYYRSIAWQMRKSGKNEHWEKIVDESLHVPFYVDDNTGRLLVDPQGAEMDIHRDFCETYSNTLFSINAGVPGNVAGFLARHGVDCDQKTKVEEFCIKPKNSLFILGTLAQNHGVETSGTPVRSLVTDLPKVVPGSPVLSFQPLLASKNQAVGLQTKNAASPSSGMSQQQKVSAALLKAGITSPGAWAVAGIMDPTSALHYSAVTATSGMEHGAAAVQTALEPFEKQPVTVLMKGTRDQTFYISWKSQRDILQSLSWKCGAMIWGGPAMTLLAAYILSTYFGWF